MTDIDVSAFHKEFDEALPNHAKSFVAKATEKSAVPKAMGLAIDLGAATGNFCSNWPKIKGFINMALGMLGWIYPAQAAAVKAFLAAAEKTIIPALCGPTA